VAEQFEEEDYTSQLDLALWLRIFRLALAHKRYLFPLIAVSAVLGFTESLLTLVTRNVIDAVVAQGSRTNLLPFGLQYGGLILVMVFCIWAFILLAGRISTDMSYDIRRQAFRKLQELSFSYYDRRPVGWLMARLTSDCERLSDIMAWSMLDLVWCITIMTSISAIMFYMDWQLALIVLTVVPALFAISAWFKRQMLQIARTVKKLNSQITASYNEGIAGVRTTKTMVREDENLKEFTGLTSSMARASIHNAVTSALYMPIVLMLASIGTGLALWQGGLATIGGTLSLGTLVAFMSYTRQFFDPVTQMASVLTTLQTAQASGERLLSLLDEVPEIKDSPQVLKAIEEHQQQGPRRGIAIDGRRERIKYIEFRGVSFKYKDGPTVLKHFNLTVHAGETIALVGPTGGGKSTIVSLLCRFYEPTSGQILVNGVDYRYRSLHWLQSNLGIVLQTPHLFNGTVMDNIRYGRLEATDEEVVEAARLVNAHEFILGQEKGYQTPVGEGGGKLSVGQKQLVSFARAVLADPQLFVMDEATSSVDTQTEQLIQKGLEQMLQGRMSFVIAHRLSTIRSADKILVIEKGRVIESGNHGELIARQGHYHQLYTRQFVHEKEVEVLGVLAEEAS
jgi:ATP-binding cassette subfamily B protein